MAARLLIVFGLPFAGVGAWSMGRCANILFSSRPAFLPLVVEWPCALVFSLVGWGLILIGLFGREVHPGEESPLAARKRMLGIESPSEQWRSGRIYSQGKSTVVLAWLGALLFFLAAAPFLGIGSLRGFIGGEGPYRLWCAAGILPLWFIGKAFYRTFRWKKFGQSICELRRRPSADRQELACSIQTQQSILPPGETTVTLRCEKRRWTGSGKNRQLERTVLWRDSKTLPPAPEGLSIDVSFTIPPETPEAADAKGEGIFWVLDARRSLPGIDYWAEFNLALARAG